VNAARRARLERDLHLEATARRSIEEFQGVGDPLADALEVAGGLVEEGQGGIVCETLMPRITDALGERVRRLRAERERRPG